MYYTHSSNAIFATLLILATPLFSHPSLTRRQAPYHAPSILDHVNPRVGTYGVTPNGNGGMIPSVAPPFAMTRWTPQTRENFISQVPYGDADRLIHGFQATHQPAIWMGEAGQVVLMPGVGDVRPLFEDRGLIFKKDDEVSTPYVYEVELDATSRLGRDWNATAEAVGDGPDPGGVGKVPEDVQDGANGRVKRQHQAAMQTDNEGDEMEDTSNGDTIHAAMSADAHTGHLRFTFNTRDHARPYIFIQATRRNWTGEVSINPDAREITGYNPERQDYGIGPDKAASFRGYFVARFSQPFASHGTTAGNTTHDGAKHYQGNFSGAYARFAPSTNKVEVRIGVSYVSIDQARTNLDLEIPNSQSFEDTVERVKAAWLDKLGRIRISGVNRTDADHDPRTIFYTALFHTLQYPSDFSEPLPPPSNNRTFYSGYTDSIHTAPDSYYQSWSIWDTYRAEHALLTLLAPERVNSMMRSLLQIFTWSGRLPIWANIVETNIMIATHVDAVLANALTRGFRGFNTTLAWQAVRKDAFVPPQDDTSLLYYDRQPNTSYEARAGLTSYAKQGWVSNDRWSESASRTLDYAFDDYACAIVGEHVSGADKGELEELRARSKNYAHVWNNETQFMRARNDNGSWARDADWGWTEGDSWVYTFDVMHDVPGLVRLFGDREALLGKLDEHFEDGHNDHTNEPSHHVPYLYSGLGAPSRAAEKIRAIAWENHNATSGGLSGNEDLGQMSAWYVFSALGFYPVDPAGDDYVVGSPFFESIEIMWPDGVATGGDTPGGDTDRVLHITAPGAPSMPYVRGLRVDGKEVTVPILKHGDIVQAARIEFAMSDTPTSWGNNAVW
ncbi:GH92 family glycosyl hydrolase [Aspergillus candidus]|uniref:Glycosyl hydrolase family 92-domain-containing protein n=1 Tax=Aspergillus candidus TaxID=41067 RepID=A0A2I2FLV4_ASPCN|nr:glycosyl hydrolase family 92-domain-containing protein [Aspergillus candidus]PLB41602.1 glycosyl hydrolase family 92-domain-containing protein [Aspergillus candidus]